MLLGIATYPAYPGTLEDFIRFASSLKVDFVEIKAEKPHASPSDMKPKKIKEIQRILNSLNLKPILHASFYDVNLSSLSPWIRKASVEQIIKCVEIGAEIGAKVVVVHGGELSREYPVDFLDEAYSALLESLNEIVLFAKKLDLTIGLENRHRSKNIELISTPQNHITALERINSPNCKAVLDIGHASTFNLEILHYIKAISPYLIEVHLHDNNGVQDEHLSLGEGKIDFLQTVNQVSLERGELPFILEMTSPKDYERSLEYLKNFVGGREDG
jgi:sugar phosphate isomerase/epimerase